MLVSQETIYGSLFIQARRVLKKELMGHLRLKRPMRRSRARSARGQSQRQILDAISIRETPAEVEDRAIPGHSNTLESEWHILFDQGFDGRRQFKKGVGQRLVAHRFIGQRLTVVTCAGGVFGGDPRATKIPVPLKKDQGKRP